MLVIIKAILFICVFYSLVLWFFHEASVRFRKMDERAGNINADENTLFKTV